MRCRRATRLTRGEGFGCESRVTSVSAELPGLWHGLRRVSQVRVTIPDARMSVHACVRQLRELLPARAHACAPQVKLWAKAHGINDGASHTFNSWCLTLLVRAVRIQMNACSSNLGPAQIDDKAPRPAVSHLRIMVPTCPQAAAGACCCVCTCCFCGCSAAAGGL